MASQARRAGYRTYGSVAYMPDYGRGAAAEGTTADSRVRLPQERPLVRQDPRTLTRTKVRVREQQAVAPFAVLGFLAAAAMAVLLLLSYVQLDAASGQVVELKNQLSALEGEHAKLLANYESAFDLQAIETELTSTGAMAAPRQDQIIYLDLSEPDNAVVYDQSEEADGPTLKGLWDKAGTYLK